MGALDEAVAAYNKPESTRSPAEVGLSTTCSAVTGGSRPATGRGCWTSRHGPNGRRCSPAWTGSRRPRRLRCPRPGASTRPARGAADLLPEARRVHRARAGGRARVPGRAGDGAGPAIEPTAGTTGRRRALADWLTRPDHPLTARVMVNRLWQGHFGRGLVGTLQRLRQDGRRAQPSRAARLAGQRVRRAGLEPEGHAPADRHERDVPAIVDRGRRPTRTADPENLLLSRQNRRRLDGEAIRDALLAASGQLNPALGGPGVFPPLPSELTRLSSKGAVWPVSARVEDRNRRSLYVFVRRNLRYPFFEAFDRPDTNASCPTRPVTTIAPQALSLLEQPPGRRGGPRAGRPRARPRPARAAMRRSSAPTASRSGDGPTRPSEALAREFLASGAPLADFCLALINANEFVYID